MNILDQLENRLDGVTRYSNYLAAICPFHQDTKPSLMVYEDWYRCLACGKGGKPEELLSEISLTSGIIKKQRKLSNPWTRWTQNASLFHACRLAWKNNNNSSEYLIRRGITPEYQKSLYLGYRDNWYTIPILDKDGRVIGATARKGETNNHPAKYINPSGQDANLLYIPSWKIFEQEPVIFLTFGILDAISIHQLGYASMSTTTGKQPNPSAFDFIRKRIVVIPDKGEERDGLALVSKLGWRGKLVKILAPDVKDVNDVFVQNKEQLKGILYELARCE